MERLPLSSFVVSRETTEKLRAYEALVLRWTRKVNLIGSADAPLFWERHILDCLQIVPLIPATAGTMIDLGSGAGLPGLVLAIVTNRDVTVIEADQRKAAFLRTAATDLGLHVNVVANRIEQAKVIPAPVVTARALAPLPKLLPLAIGKLADNGVCLFLKGQSVEAELTLAQNQWHMKIERFASRTSPDSTILRLSEIARATSSLVKSSNA